MTLEQHGERQAPNTYLVLVAVRDEDDLTSLTRMGCDLAREREGAVRAVTVHREAERPDWMKIPEACKDVPIEMVVRQGQDVGTVLLEEIQKTKADTLLVGWKGQLSRGRYRLGQTLDPVVRNAPCDVLLLAGAYGGKVERVLIPIGGGPNAPEAVNIARTLLPKAKITALYVASQQLGATDVLLGKERLDTVLSPLHLSDVKRKVVQAPNPAAGILEEAREGYDLLLLGAGGESFLNRFLFGSISQAILSQTDTPTIVVRRRLTNLGTLQRRVWHKIFGVMPTLDAQQQATAYRLIRRGARPRIDFWVMIALATAIAALGLLLNSPAVIIGAMLIAPFMNAILGIGLSIVMGDLQFLLRALSTTVRGALLAILMGFLMTLIVPGAAPTDEILIRANPTLLDLAVALAAGAAAAYATCRPDVSAALAGVAIAAALDPPLANIGIGIAMQEWKIAWGAALLFTTNLIAISAAGGLLFLWLGFQPRPGALNRNTILRRGAWGILILLFLISVPLTILTQTSTRRIQLQQEIKAALEQELEQQFGAELVEWTFEEDRNSDDNALQIDATVRVIRPLTHAEARQLQERVAERLERSVALSIGMVSSTRLRAYVPLTPTETAATSPTSTATPQLTATPVPTRTPRPSPTLTPWDAVVTTETLAVYYAPGGLVVDGLESGVALRVIEGPVDVEGETWYRVQVPAQHLEGWVFAAGLAP